MPPKNVKGPLSVLENPDKYNYEFFKYPLDLGEDPGQNHFIVFYINENTNTAYSINDMQVENIAQALSVTDNNSKEQIEEYRKKINEGRSRSSKGELKTTRDQLQEIDSKVNSSNGSQNNTVRKNIGSSVRRTTSAIVLYMPNELTFDYSLSYQETDTGLLGAFAKSAELGEFRKGMKSLLSDQSTQGTAGRMAKENFTKDVADKVAKTARGELLKELADKTGSMDTLGLIAGGYAANPHMETIFKNAEYRKFSFNFLFAPRDPQEAIAVKNIIKLFRFNSAPELVPSFGNSFFVYPGEFDIKFYSNGRENAYLNKISSCVLESVSVNYAANQGGQFVAFDITDDDELNGASVITSLQLSFRETELITKERILLGY